MFTVFYDPILHENFANDRLFEFASDKYEIGTHALSDWSPNPML